MLVAKYIFVIFKKKDKNFCNKACFLSFEW